MKRKAEEPPRHLLTLCPLVFELRDLDESVRNHDVLIIGRFVVFPPQLHPGDLSVPPRRAEF